MAKRGYRMQLTLALLLTGVALAIAVYDIYATFGPGSQYTVSALIGEWSTRTPFVPFLFGILGGHLFWPRGPIQPPSQIPH